MLQSIQGYVERALDPAWLRACLSECRRQVERISRIVDHLRTLGQSGEVKMREVDLARILDNELSLVGEWLHANQIELERLRDDCLTAV